MQSPKEKKPLGREKSSINLPKPKAVNPQKPKRIKKTQEELREAKILRQRAYYRRKVGRDVKPQSVVRQMVKGMTPEQKQARKTELSRMRYARKKELGLLKPRSLEEKAKRHEYWVQYYEKKKQDEAYLKQRNENQKNYYHNVTKLRNVTLEV